MTQKTETRSNRRIDRRRRPKAWTRVTCRKGILDLGADISLGILDVSETGIRLLVGAKLNQGDEVTVTLDSPNIGRPIRIVSRVAWCVQTRNNVFCVGVRFDKRLRYMDVTSLA